MKNMNQKIGDRRLTQRIYIWMALCMLLASAAILSLSNNQVYADTDSMDDESTATQNVVLSMDAIPAGANGTIAVPVMVTGADNLGSFGIEVYYEPLKLRVTDCQVNEDLGGLGLCNKGFGKNSVRFSSAVAEGISGDVQIAVVTFETIGALDQEIIPRLAPDVVADGIGNPAPFKVAEANQPVFNWLNFLPLIQR